MDKVIVAGGDSGLTLATADTITGFTSGADKIVTGTAGINTNTSIADGSSMVNLAAVITAAETVFNGTFKFYVAYDVNNTGDGYLLWDVNGNNSFDGNDALIKLSGVDTSGKFVFADIAAN